jgi:hypothetical protein
LKNLKEINCANSLLSKNDLQNLIKNNKNLKIVYDYHDKRKLFGIYYSREKYFVNNNIDSVHFYKKFWYY